MSSGYWAVPTRQVHSNKPDSLQAPVAKLHDWSTTMIAVGLRHVSCAHMYNLCFVRQQLTILCHKVWHQWTGLENTAISAKIVHSTVIIYKWLVIMHGMGCMFILFHQKHFFLKRFINLPKLIFEKHLKSVACGPKTKHLILHLLIFSGIFIHECHGYRAYTRNNKINPSQASHRHTYTIQSSTLLGNFFGRSEETWTRYPKKKMHALVVF